VNINFELDVDLKFVDLYSDLVDYITGRYSLQSYA